VRSIVHENLNVNEAYNSLLSDKNEKAVEKGQQLQHEKMIKSVD
jgi:hypothetical protein